LSVSGFFGKSQAVTIVVRAGINGPTSGTPEEVVGTGARAQPPKTAVRTAARAIRMGTSQSSRKTGDATGRFGYHAAVDFLKKRGTMSEHTPTSAVARRSFLASLGAGVSVAGVSLAGAVPDAAAQAAAGGGRYQPARHAQDDWMDSLPGRHRFVIDSSNAAGFGAALLYANNFFTANESGYGLKDPDSAIIIVARHFSTPYVYKDAVWAKYGAAMAAVTGLNDPKTKQPPAINVYNAPGNDSLASLGTTVDAVLKRGVHFAVCQMATRFIAGLLAGSGGNADAVYNELVGGLVANSHMVAAGVVAVNRAQERGYTMLTAF